MSTNRERPFDTEIAQRFFERGFAGGHLEKTRMARIRVYSI